jgi:hypothetical protein
MTDRDEIISRLYEYAYGIDLRDFELYRSIFCEQVRIDFSSYEGRGGPRTTTADHWVAQVQPLFVGLDATQHTMSNPLVDVDGDRARCRMYMQAAHFLWSAPEPEFTIGGYYDDTLLRTADGWRIDGVTLTVWWRRGDAAIMTAARELGRRRLDRDG